MRLSPRKRLPVSILLDQNDFYKVFLRDLQSARQEVIIESPFMTVRRVQLLMHVIKELNARGVKIIVNTKPIQEQESIGQEQAAACIALLQAVGVLVLQTGGHHRKVVVIDRSISFEGSLNVLSYRQSAEMMRRTHNRKWAAKLINFLNIKHVIG